MNGDSAISPPMKGLRIANPDATDSISPSPPLVSPPRSPASSPSSAAAPSSLPSSALDTGLDNSRSSISQVLDPGLLSASQPATTAPTARTANPAFSSSQHYSAAPADVQSRYRRLSHRQSMPLTYQAQQQIQFPTKPRTRNPPHSNNLGRPLSGLYSHPNMSSSSGPTPESTYQRARAESGHSTNGLVRDLPRSTAASGLHGSNSVRENHTDRTYRQHSHSNLANGTSPSQRVPGRAPGGFDPGYSSTPPNSGILSGSPYGLEGGPLASSEEWKDRGAATSTKKEIDADGKLTTRSVKKGVKDFHFGRTLGEGSYSTVLAATDRQTSKEYAIKVLDKRHIIKEKKVKYVNIEKDTLNRLTDHPGVVRLYYTFQDERSLYFVLDLASGGELLGVLKKMTSFDEECTRFYGAQILDSIEYMHLRGIIHRDLKPENVLLDDQMHVKITDFGTAKILDIGSQFGTISTVRNNPLDGSETDRAVSFVGTAEYVSPELLTDKNACKASDLWAFGCIIYQLLAGRPPFKAGNEYQTFQKIVALDYTFPEFFPPVARDLVEKLLILDPGQRLPIESIKNHRFFDGIQWGKGLWKQKAPRLKPYVPPPKDPGFSLAPIDSAASSVPSSTPSATRPSVKSAPPSSNVIPGNQKRPQPHIVTALAPPSQLDIAWSPVLTKNNERILKIGNLSVYSAPAPHSPISKLTTNSDAPADTSSKFSRFFGSSTTKKRSRLVMITSAGRIVLAPAGGDKKEAKMVISLLDPDVSWKSLMDTKGYTVWCVFTREKHFTFEDPKANTGDSGSSVRSTQQWLECIESARNSASLQSPDEAYPTDGTFDDMQQSRSGPASPRESDAGLGSQAATPPALRKTLRKNHDAEADSLKGRKLFSKRHSKNGLAAVF